MIFHAVLLLGPVFQSNPYSSCLTRMLETLDRKGWFSLPADRIGSPKKVQKHDQKAHPVSLGRGAEVFSFIQLSITSDLFSHSSLFPHVTHATCP